MGVVLGSCVPEEPEPLAVTAGRRRRTAGSRMSAWRARQRQLQLRPGDRDNYYDDEEEDEEGEGEEDVLEDEEDEEDVDGDGQEGLDDDATLSPAPRTARVRRSLMYGKKRVP